MRMVGYLMLAAAMLLAMAVHFSGPYLGLTVSFLYVFGQVGNWLLMKSQTPTKSIVAANLAMLAGVVAFALSRFVSLADRP